MVGFTVTLTTRISCFRLMTSASRTKAISAIQRPLHLAGMAYPSRHHGPRLQEDVRDIKRPGAVRDAHPHRDGLDPGGIILRRDPGGS
ncbi:hypothetical protein MKC97_12825 [[Clostridium] innocuum]|nr:hypothetical protein [[Clostridium] innocuum]